MLGGQQYPHISSYLTCIQAKYLFVSFILPLENQGKDKKQWIINFV